MLQFIKAFKLQVVPRNWSHVNLLAFFEASLSLESRDDLEELTGNQSEEEIEDEPEDSWNTQEFVEHSRRQKNFKMYKVYLDSIFCQTFYILEYNFVCHRLLPQQFCQWWLI